MTEGFRLAGFTPVLAIELDKWAADTYERNFGPHVLRCPIESVKVSIVENELLWRGTSQFGVNCKRTTPRIDVLIGGPPCQGFSPLGRMKDWEFSDPRNEVIQHFLRLVKLTRPNMFVLENVPQLIKSEQFIRFKARAKRLGYAVETEVLDASYHGVPQARRRAIVLGSRIGVPRFPEASILARPTVRAAFRGLPKQPDGKNWHVGRNPSEISLERYRSIPYGGNRFDLMRARPDLTPPCWLRKSTGSTDVFGRMIWSEPAPTIRTEFYKPEKGRYLHPEADRPITIREAARLQTFPDSFTFVGSRAQVAKQIGNAIPIELARRIALAVRAHLERSSESGELRIVF